MSHNGETGPGESPPGGLAAGLLPKANRTPALLFAASTFFFWLSLYMYVPILPVYAQSLGASLVMVGVVVASYAVPQLVLRVPMGLWSDALGRRKPMVLAGVVMSLAGAVGMWLATDPVLLTIGRTATGVGAATWSLFTVYFVSFYPARSIGRAVGFVNFLQASAIVVASLGGGFIAQGLGSRGTFFGAAVFAVVALVALLPAREVRPAQRGSFAWQDLVKVAANRHLLVVSFMAILLQFAQFATVFGFIPVYGAEIGASKAELGIITMLATVSGAISALAAPRLVERRGYPIVLLSGALLMAAATAAVPFIGSVTVLSADQFFAGLGRGLIMTTLMAQSIHMVPAHQRATAMGIYQATYAIGMLLGPLTSGFVADSLGLGAVFYLCSLMGVLIAVMAYVPIKTRAS